LLKGLSGNGKYEAYGGLWDIPGSSAALGDQIKVLPHKFYGKYLAVELRGDSFTCIAGKYG